MRQPDRRRAHVIAQIFGQIGGGGLLDQFLVVALQRTVAVPQMQQGAVAVAHHLHLDMAGTGRVAFEENRCIAKRAFRLGPGGGNGLRRVGQIGDKSHAAPASPRTRLDQKRRAKRPRFFQQPRVGLVGAAVTGQDRHTRGLCGGLGLDL